MNWKQLLGDYFNFSRKERIAVLVLVVLISGLLFVPALLRHQAPGTAAPADTAWITSLKELQTNSSEQPDNPYERRPAYDPGERTRPGAYRGGELFYFDPNTLSAEGWKKLGLRDKTIRTILNYTAKGGRFNKPEDLQKIYGLFPDELKRILPFVRIASQPPGDSHAPEPAGPRKSIEYAPVDINLTDTSGLIALPGIGSKLALRIIRFREALGGFYSVAQVAETFGLPDSVFVKIKPYLLVGDLPLKKIDINTATLDELKAHPYIRYSIAKQVIAYRSEHGKFHQTEDIKKVMAITLEVYDKIKHYLICSTY